MKLWFKSYWLPLFSGASLMVLSLFVAMTLYASRAKLGDIVRAEFEQRGVVTSNEFLMSYRMNMMAHSNIFERLEKVEGILSDYRGVAMTNQLLLQDMHLWLWEQRFGTNPLLKPTAGGWR